MDISYPEVHTNSSHNFLLMYGVKEMVLVKLMVHSARLALISRLYNPHDWNYNVEALEEGRHSAESKWLSYENS